MSDPPYRLDPFRRIVNVNFGTPTKFKFTAGDNHFSIHPELQSQGLFSEFSFSSPAAYSSGPLVQEDGNFTTGEGNWLHGSDDRPMGDADYFAINLIELTGHDTVLLDRELRWVPPVAISGLAVWELTIPGFPRTFRTDALDYDAINSQWAPLSAAYTFTAGTQYDCTWIQIA